MSEAAKKEPPRYEPQPSIVGALVRNLMSLFFVGISVMSVYNVFGVGGEVEVMAKETACQGQPLPCTAQYTKGARTPWAHTYKMYTSPTSGEFEVSCRRQYIFVGDYSCKANGRLGDVDPTGAPLSSDRASTRLAPSASALVRFPPKTKIPVPTRPQSPQSATPSASSTSDAPAAPAGSP